MTRRGLPPMVSRRRLLGARRSDGFTMVELLVAMALGLLITGVAVFSLIAARRGFTSVDDLGQLRENARFTTDIVQRIAVQAGFEDVAGAGNLAVMTANGLQKAFVGIEGFDNAVVNAATLPVIATDSRDSGCSVADTSCVNGSDALVIRYMGANAAGSTDADGSMINCAGGAEAERPASAPSISIFHVHRSATGEPTLVCSFQQADGSWKQEGLVQGVEAFQVMYGVNGVVPNTVPVVTTLTSNSAIPERYLTARQMVVAGNASATQENWQRVRSLRIGMVFRGNPNMAVDKGSQKTIPVFGEGVGSATDKLSNLVVQPDGRLRQTLVFEVHLRNPQRL